MPRLHCLPTGTQYDSEMLLLVVVAQFEIQMPWFPRQAARVAGPVSLKTLSNEVKVPVLTEQTTKRSDRKGGQSFKVPH